MSGRRVPHDFTLAYLQPNLENLNETSSVAKSCNTPAPLNLSVSRPHDSTSDNPQGQHEFRKNTSSICIRNFLHLFSDLKLWSIGFANGDPGQPWNSRSRSGSQVTL